MEITGARGRAVHTITIAGVVLASLLLAILVAGAPAALAAPPAPTYSQQLGFAATPGVNPFVFELNCDDNILTQLADDRPDVSISSGVVGSGVVAMGIDPNPVITDYTALIYVADYDSGTLNVVQPPAVIQEMPVGEGPYAVAVNPTNHQVWVANYLSDTVVLLSGGGFDGQYVPAQITAIFPVPDGPQVLALNTQTNTCYVGCASGDLIQLDGDLQQPTITATGAVDDPVAIAVNEVSNQVAVTSEGNGMLTIANGSNVAQWVQPPDLVLPGDISVAADTKDGLFWVTEETMDEVAYVGYDFANPNIWTIGQLPTGEWPASVGYDPETGLVFALNIGSQTVTVIDASAQQVASTITLPTAGEPPVQLWVQPSVKKVYVALANSDVIAFSEPTTTEVTDFGSLNRVEWGSGRYPTTKFFVKVRTPGTHVSFDIVGKSGVLRRLYSGPGPKAGKYLYTRAWDGRDAHGRRLPTGAYTYRVKVTKGERSTVLRDQVVVCRTSVQVKGRSGASASGRLSRGRAQVLCRVFKPAHSTSGGSWSYALRPGGKRRSQAVTQVTNQLAAPSWSSVMTSTVRIPVSGNYEWTVRPRTGPYGAAGGNAGARTGGARMDLLVIQ